MVQWFNNRGWSPTLGHVTRSHTVHTVQFDFATWEHVNNFADSLTKGTCSSQQWTHLLNSWQIERAVHHIASFTWKSQLFLKFLRAFCSLGSFRLVALSSSMVADSSLLSPGVQSSSRGTTLSLASPGGARAPQDSWTSAANLTVRSRQIQFWVAMCTTSSVQFDRLLDYSLTCISERHYSSRTSIFQDPSADHCSGMECAQIHVLPDSVLRFGEGAMHEATNKFTKRWMEHFADKGVIYAQRGDGTCLAEPRQGETPSPLRFKFHVFSGATTSQIRGEIDIWLKSRTSSERIHRVMLSGMMVRFSCRRSSDYAARQITQNVKRRDNSSPKKPAVNSALAWIQRVAELVRASQSKGSAHGFTSH